MEASDDACRERPVKHSLSRAGYLLIAVVAAGVALSLAACQSSPQPAETKRLPSVFYASGQTTTVETPTRYENPVYGYMISYPQGWQVDDSNTNLVRIGHFPELATVEVRSYDLELPLNDRVDAAIEEYLSPFEDAMLIYSREPDSVWDWEVAYRYFWGDWEFLGQIFVIQMPDNIFLVHWDATTESGLAETCRAISQTFVAR